MRPPYLPATRYRGGQLESPRSRPPPPTMPARSSACGRSASRPRDARNSFRSSIASIRLFLLGRTHIVARPRSPRLPRARARSARSQVLTRYRAFARARARPLTAARRWNASRTAVWKLARPRNKTARRDRPPRLIYIYGAALPRYPAGPVLSYGNRRRACHSELIEADRDRHPLLPRSRSPASLGGNAPRTTTRQHHKSHRANNKIPVAHAPTQVSFHLRHSHTCRCPALSPSLLPPPSPRASRSSFPSSPLPPTSARNSSPFLNSRNRVAVHSRFAPRRGRRSERGGKREGKREGESRCGTRCGRKRVNVVGA